MYANGDYCDYGGEIELRPHMLRTQYSDQPSDEVQAWCKEHLTAIKPKQKFYYRYRFFRYRGMSMTVVDIPDPEDYLLFKMRWF